MSKELVEKPKPLTARQRRIIKEACPGCHSGRYNRGIGYQESSMDAPVTVNCCWWVDGAKYNRVTKRFECRFWSKN